MFETGGKTLAALLLVSFALFRHFFQTIIEAFVSIVNPFQDRMEKWGGEREQKSSSANSDSFFL